MRFVLNWLITSLGVAAATYLLPHITPVGNSELWICFAGTGLFVSLVNYWVKPLVSFVALPLSCLTLGIFQLIVNGCMLELASWLSLNVFGVGIAIAGLPAAVAGSVLVSFFCTIFGGLVNAS